MENLPDVSLQDLQKELDRRDRALTTLDGFRDWMRPANHLDFMFDPEPHHQLLCEVVQKIGNGLIKHMKGEPLPDDFIQKLLAALPPASAKSTYFSIQLPVWLLAALPTIRILCVANTQSRSEDFNRRRRSAVGTDEFRQLSGHTLDPDNKGVARFGTTAGGFIAAVGAGAAIAGIRADIIICDDLVASFEEASSREQLDKLFDYYLADVRTRADSPYTPELIIGTRWSNYDPIGRFLERTEQGHEKWYHLCLPLVAGNKDPLGRKPGEILWPEKFAPRLDEIKLDPATFAALYQQQPLTSAGNFFAASDFEIVDRVPPLEHQIASDLALTIDAGDYSVHLPAGFDENRDLYILGMYRERKALNHVAEGLERLCTRYSPSQVLIDDDNASRVFRNYLFERNINVPIMLRPMRGQKKQVRAANARAMAQQGRIKLHRGDWNHDFLHEITRFPDGRNDDIVDCLALLGREAYRLSAAQKLPPVQKPDSGAYHQVAGRVHTRATMDDLFTDRERRRRRY